MFHKTRELTCEEAESDEKAKINTIDSINPLHPPLTTITLGEHWPNTRTSEYLRIQSNLHRDATCLQDYLVSKNSAASDKADGRPHLH